MAQVCFEQIDNNWVSFEDLVGSGFSSTATYELQNRGNDNLLALESNSIPTAENMAGLIIKPLDIFSYKKGTQTLYLRALPDNCSINARSDEEMSEYAPNLIKKVITENGSYNAADEGADGYSELTVDVPMTRNSGQIKITTVNEVIVNGFETAIIEDSNLLPSNIKKDVQILGLTGTYEGESQLVEPTVLAVNNSSYERKVGEKVWVKFFDDDYEIIDCTDADADTFTGTLLEPAPVGNTARVKTITDGLKTYHEFTYDFIDMGNPHPILNYDNNTVTFSDLSQSLTKEVRNIPTPETSVEVVVKMKSDGTGTRNYNGTGCYFFQDTNDRSNSSLFSIWCGDGVYFEYRGSAFGGINGNYILVNSKDFFKGEWYWVRVLFRIGYMYVFLSTDGATWEEIFRVGFGFDMFDTFTSDRNEFCLRPFKTDETVDGIYDLMATYIKIDGDTVWRPLKPVEGSY